MACPVALALRQIRPAARRLRVSQSTRWIEIGRGMFLRGDRRCRDAEVVLALDLFSYSHPSSRCHREEQPPARAPLRSRRRQAGRPPSATTSPRLIPIRNSMPTLARKILIVTLQRPLDGNSRADSLHRARELNHHAIARGSKDAASMLGNQIGDRSHDEPASVRRVPSSSAATSRLYPTTSAARIAARRRVTGRSSKTDSDWSKLSRKLAISFV